MNSSGQVKTNKSKLTGVKIIITIKNNTKINEQNKNENMENKKKLYTWTCYAMPWTLTSKNIIITIQPTIIHSSYTDRAKLRRGPHADAELTLNLVK